DTRRLNGNSPRTAHRVYKRRLASPLGAEENRGGECLAKRRFGDGLAISTQVEQRARRVDTDRADVVNESDHAQLRKFGCTLHLFIRLLSESRANAGNTSLDGFREPLRDGAAVIELRLSAGDTKLDRGLRRDPTFPLDSFCTELELMKGFGSELGNADNHAVGGAEPEVRACH